jgi:hypothetical protein
MPQSDLLISLEHTEVTLASNWRGAPLLRGWCRLSRIRFETEFCGASRFPQEWVCVN